MSILLEDWKVVNIYSTCLQGNNALPRHSCYIRTTQSSKDFQPSLAHIQHLLQPSAKPAHNINGPHYCRVTFPPSLLWLSFPEWHSSVCHSRPCLFLVNHILVYESQTWLRCFACSAFHFHPRRSVFDYSLARPPPRSRTFMVSWLDRKVNIERVLYPFQSPLVWRSPLYSCLMQQSPSASNSILLRRDLLPFQAFDTFAAEHNLLL